MFTEFSVNVILMKNIVFLVLCMRVVFMLLFAYTNFVLIETFSIVAFSAERFK